MLFDHHLAAPQDPHNEEAVPSDNELDEEPSRAIEGSEDEGEDLLEGMEA